MYQKDVTMTTLYTFNNRASEIQETLKFDPYLHHLYKLPQKGS